jgi:uncharacterized protein (DUF302 family)
MEQVNQVLAEKGVKWLREIGNSQYLKDRLGLNKDFIEASGEIFQKIYDKGFDVILPFVVQSFQHILGGDD